jgi:hypothetical protein
MKINLNVFSDFEELERKFSKLETMKSKSDLDEPVEKLKKYPSDKKNKPKRGKE